MIALDIDGTIVQSDLVTISPRMRTSIRQVSSAGHHVVLSTGRSPAATVPVATTLSLASGFIVCSNGAATLRMAPAGPDGYTVLAEETFDPEQLLSLLGREIPDCALAVEMPGVQAFRTTADFPSGVLPGEVHVVPRERLRARGVRRLIVHSMESPVRIADALGLDCVSESTGVRGSWEIGPRRVSKASALEELRIRLGVALTDTVAIGDQINDIEMLRWAARGVAMGHAPESVKKAAVEVTRSCADDGAAIVLESMLATTMAPDPQVR